MDKGSLSHNDVVQAAKKVVACYADATDQRKPSIAYSKYGVRSIPSVIFVDAQGERLDTLDARSAFDPKKFVAKIDAVVENYKEGSE